MTWKKNVANKTNWWNDDDDDEVKKETNGNDFMELYCQRQQKNELH